MAAVSRMNSRLDEDPNGRGPYSTGNSHSHGSEESSNSRSPLASLGFLKNLTAEKKLKPDGQPPKRRGPKPDSKPALTRRQELNRQAQRTHRERKELYIKALEQEVLRLKESYGDVCRERDTFAQCNRKLRELLMAHGIPVPDDFGSPPYLQDPDSMRSVSVQANPDSSPNTLSPQSAAPVQGQQAAMQNQHARNGYGNGNSPLAPQPINYDQVGIDFVLALEKPCMDHMQMLCTRSQTSDGEISGHAMMATCPPASHINEHPDVQYPHKMPDMNHGDLLRLLDLSNRLPLDGEITPVMAWSQIVQDVRFRHLTEQDFTDMKVGLTGKIRCYGFGAVLEEFEVRDALENVVAARGDGRGPGTTSLLY